MNKRVLLFGVVAMLAALTACNLAAHSEKPEMQTENVVPIEYVYEKDTIRYGEISGAFSFVKEVERTETDCVIYYFEASIDNQDRKACIIATDKVLERIDGMLPKIEIVILKPESYDGVLISGNRLYTSTQPWDSAEYIAEVLLAAYGEWGNYGLAYGYANYLCKEEGLDYRETDGFQQMSGEELYDLNLLCFNEKFVSLEDVEAAKSNACCFVNEYLSAHSEEEFLKRLSDSGDVEGVQSANEALESFYKDNGVECSLTDIRYQYGGVTFDYAAGCEYARFYIEKDWKDGTWETNPRVSENFLHEDYKEAREFFECNARQMELYQELFDFDSYNNDLPVIFSDNAYKIADADSFYQIGNHTIYVSSVVSLNHEYIHSVTRGRIDFGIPWKSEGIASYYGSQFNAYAYDFWNNDYNNPADNVMGSYLKKYIDWIGRPIDFETDHWEMENLKVYAYGYTDPNLTHTGSASFVGYLINQYGGKAVITYVCSDDTYNAEWGKSYEELVQDWNDYINENYSWYSVE